MKGYFDMKASSDMPEVRYVVNYGAKVKQAETLMNHIASLNSAYLYLKNPGEEPILIKNGCELTFIQLESTPTE